MTETPTTSEHPADLIVGTVSGLAAGLVGAVAMTGFQAALAKGGITSGVSGPPSTEKAAERVAKAAGARRVPRDRRAAAGDAVHNLFGAAVGGLYGAAAELSPRVTAGRGTAFGAAAATVVDETLVPAFKLGDPFWKAPLRSHPYSYVSHLVFGTVTDLARRWLRRFFVRVRAGAKVVRQHAVDPPVVAEARATAPRRHTLPLAFLLGACAGPRTSAPLLIASWAAARGWIDLKGSPLAFLARPNALKVTGPMAVGELIVDKLPSTPHRTEPVGVAARAVSGAVSGAALAGGRSPAAALAGAAGALAATYAGHAIRTRLSRQLGRDAPVAVVEDLLAFGGATLVLLAALAPARLPVSAPRRRTAAGT